MLNFKQRREQRDTNMPIVKFFLQTAEIDLGQGGNLVDALLRKALKAEAKKMQRKYAHLVHPETGERPDIHMVIVEQGKTKVEIVLVTDSPILRGWLKDKGIVIAERNQENAPVAEDSAQS